MTVTMKDGTVYEKVIVVGGYTPKGKEGLLQIVYETTYPIEERAYVEENEVWSIETK